ncbi:MAG: tRNA (adenosine(37)-N6)-threonylcarbamoyltransferase complex dimerization subunit type 1 TsaB [Gammaproteobacteria bacterium]|nr:tRNA (adenosine(37)-N6)-threonylcarbamoyltransferase complex dimerization subunit type 1 TsaB [Gammaproteobacteria bacterium]NNL99932.1 tRNA (adenosine(37)-N6)-threonylcarbamoyltransferase complex dimerization subunit type 1 TsaB [Gammaproteobacteria bacterium]
MRILALDTATDACSAALLCGDAVTETFEIAPRQHTALLLPMIDRLMQAAELTPRDLDAVALSAGPGSFTGLRIAAGVAQGIALGADLPVARVSSLAALALRAGREHDAPRILAAFDARMGEVYWGAYALDAGDTVTVLSDDAVTPPDAVTLPPGEHWLGAGDGWRAHHDALHAGAGTRLAAVAADSYPGAREVALLGRRIVERGAAVAPEEAIPYYLRDRVTRAG